MKKISALLLLLSFNSILVNAQNTSESVLNKVVKQVKTWLVPHYEYEVIDYSSPNDSIKVDNKFYKAEVLKKQSKKIKDLAKIEFKEGQWLHIQRINDKKFKFKIGFDRFHPNATMTIYTIYDFLDKADSNWGYTKGKGANNDEVVLKNPIRNEEVNNRYKRKSIALIIGNANYEDSNSNWQNIPNAVEDAYSVAKKLRTLGFETYVKLNLNKDSLLFYFDALKNTAVNSECEIALFYFSGHGIEDKNGVDYIIPVHPPKNSIEFYIPTDSIKYYIYEGMEKYLPKNRWIFIDACRDSDIKLESKSMPDTKRPNYTIVMHSTYKGKKANFYANPDDAISPFAKAFINFIDSSNIKMSNVLALIRKNVYNESQASAKSNNDVYEQDPEVVVGDNCDYILNPQNQDISYGGSINLDTIPSCWYLGPEVSFSKTLESTGGGGLHGGVYLSKGWFGEIGTTINYLNSDELYLYNSPEALTPSESFNYKFRWDIFARIGHHWLRNSEHSFALYGELSHEYFFSTYSKGDFNVLDPSINAKYVWKPKKFWSYYCSIGMGLPKGMGDNYDRVKDAINLKSPDFRIQIGVNYRFKKKVQKK